MSDSGQKSAGLAHKELGKTHGRLLQTNAGTFGAVHGPSAKRSQGHKKGGRHGRLAQFR